MSIEVNWPNRRRSVLIADLATSAVVILILSLEVCFPRVVHVQVSIAEAKEQDPERYTIHSDSEKSFRFDGLSDRVSVGDTPEFHFGSNQDFSVEACIKAYPSSSPLAQR